RLLVGARFQVLFHSPPGVLFTFPSRYWFAIGDQGVFSLGSGSSRFPAGFLVSRRTQDPRRGRRAFGYGAVTPSGGPFQAASPSTLAPSWRVLLPRCQTAPVWARSVSLAATREIALAFSSSGY